MLINLRFKAKKKEVTEGMQQLSAFSVMYNSECQGISDLSASTMSALADIQFIPDLFHMKEALFPPDNSRIRALFSCLHIHVTIPVRAT